MGPAPKCFFSSLPSFTNAEFYLLAAACADKKFGLDHMLDDPRSGAKDAAKELHVKGLALLTYRNLRGEMKAGMPGFGSTITNVFPTDNGRLAFELLTAELRTANPMEMLARRSKPREQLPKAVRMALVESGVSY